MTMGEDAMGARRLPLGMRLRTGAPVLGVMVALIAAAALVGWAIDGPLLKSIVPGTVTMKVNTALGLIFLAIALFSQQRATHGWRIVTFTSISAVAILSLAMLAEYAFHIDLRIDNALFVDRESPKYPGRSAPATNFAFLGLAAAFGLIAANRGILLAQLIVFVVSLTPLVTLGGYLYRAPGMYENAPYPAVALNTSVGILLLCLGGLFARADAGLMSTVTADTLAGSLARKLLPAAIGLPLLTGLLVLTGERAGLYSVAFGSALMMSCCALFFAAAVCWSVVLLSNAEHAQARTERRVREGEEYLQIAIETARLGSWQVDLATGAIQGTARYKANLGMSSDDLIVGDRLRAALHPEDRIAAQAAFDDAIATHGEYHAEYRVVWPDGSTHWLVASGRAIYDDAGKPVRAVGVTLDVTAEKNAQAERERLLDVERRARTQSEQANRMKDEFLATLSHELRTPLSAIFGWAQILRRPNTKPETLADGLAAIERNARAQTQIIGDLLDMGSILNGKVSLDARTIDLAATINAAIGTVRPTATAKEITIAFDPPTGARYPMVGDVNRLQQVFWNLLSNAVKFTPRGGRVEVRIDQRHSLWQVDVIDTGEGIAPEFLPLVFDRFSQADASTTRQHGGLGLGLAIVKQLVELHGGKARAHSAGVGVGSTFVVSLPVRVVHDGPMPPGATDPAADANTPAGDLLAATPDDGDWDPALCDVVRGKTVLIVDDEADARAVLKRLLSDCMAKVLVAASTDEALQIIDATPPDILISDIGMPGSDGYDLIRKVRQRESTKGGRLPAIALTAYARTEDRMKVIRAGFQTHVAKPVEPAELLTVIGGLLEQIGR